MWKQVSRERKMAEVVGTNLQFKPVGGRAAWGDHNASVVDENIEARKSRNDFSRSPLNAFEVCKVEFDEMNHGLGMLLKNAFSGLLCSGAATAGENHFSAFAREFHRHLKPDAAIGTGDEDDRPLLSGRVAQSPFLIEAFSRHGTTFSAGDFNQTRGRCRSRFHRWVQEASARRFR